MTQREIERTVWGILAQQLTEQSQADLMAHVGWLPDTAPPAEARRWSRAIDHITQMVARHASTQRRSSCQLAGQMSIQEAEL